MLKNLLYDFHLEIIKSNKSNEKNSLTVLDYGCGYGNFIKYARENALTVVGADNFYGDSTIIEDSKVIDDIDIFIIKKDGKLTFNYEKFDFVTAMQVFEHVENMKLV